MDPDERRRRLRYARFTLILGGAVVLGTGAYINLVTVLLNRPGWPWSIFALIPGAAVMAVGLFRIGFPADVR